MPAITRYYEPSSPYRSNYLKTYYAQDLVVRQEWFDRVWDYYHGKHQRQLEKFESEPDDNVVLNYVKQVVDRTITFLFPSFPALELDPDITTVTPDEEWLRMVWEESGGIALLHEMVMLGSIGGSVYLRIMPPDPANGFDLPQIVVLDPLSMQTYWDASNVRKVLWHEMHWTVEDENISRDYIIDFVNNGTSWELLYYESSIGAGQTGMYQLVGREIWPSALPPIIHAKHLPNPRNYYGMSEFTPAQLDLNDKINLVASEANRIIRYHSGPRTVATGAEAADITPVVGVNQMWAIANPDAKIENLELRSDLSAATAHLERLRGDFLAESRVVILEGQVKDFQRVTNAGVRTVFLDPISKNLVLQWNYGKLIQKASQVAGYVGQKGFDLQPDVVFEDALPVDDVERVNTAMLERQMGIVSRQTVSTKRGYNWPMEVTKMTQEEKLEIFKAPEPAQPAGNELKKGQSKNLQNDPNSTSNK